VANGETYHVSPTERLREHEAMHVRINEREAVRIESVLKRFSSKKSMDEAERELKNRFNKEVEKVRRLHADWDENHVFAVDPPTPDPE
jgi:predicted secreted Zn-dependent protease